MESSYADCCDRCSEGNCLMVGMFSGANPNEATNRSVLTFRQYCLWGTSSAAVRNGWKDNDAVADNARV